VSEWTLDRKRDAAIRAPLGPGFRRADTRVIERAGWYQIVTPSAPGTLLNEIVLSEVDAADAERVIDEAIAVSHSAGRAVKWCVGPWTRPTDFGARLTRRGFTAWDVRGMGCDPQVTLVDASHAHVTEATEQHADAIVRTAMRGWSIRDDQYAAERATYEQALRESPRVGYLFGAWLDGECVGTSGLLMRDDYGYLAGTQVDDRARGRGLYRELVAARLAFLRARGVCWAVTQAREATSAPILERFGFETLFRSCCYVLAPKG
jgi:GNAT superfamily N-acetyltransferase